ncbi:MAG: hypothetical protein NT169_27570 [Chloroflexi bacterium]|nr:hypothetical protein [Chloroflexota bacterium]
MRSSTLAGLLLIVMFMGLALIIVMFGVVPAFNNLMEEPAPQPVAATMMPRPTEADAAPQATSSQYLSRFGTATPSPEISGTETPTPDPTTAAKAKTLVREMLQRDATGVSYRFTTWGTYSMAVASSKVNPISFRIDGEADHGNSRQIMTTNDQAGDTQFSQLETRVVDGVSYTYANRQWQKGTGAQASMQQRFFQNPVDFLDSSVRLTYVGAEQLPDVPVSAYKYHFEIASGQLSIANLPPDTSSEAIPKMETQQDGYLWVGTDERRYRIEYRMRLYTPQSGLMLGWDLTTRYFDYDDPTIHIEAPQGAIPSGQ